MKWHLVTEWPPPNGAYIELSRDGGKTILDSLWWYHTEGWELEGLYWRYWRYSEEAR